MGVLQQQLHEVVPIILEALECDEPDLVGTNTRDAASYACFALAGAYEPDALQEFVESIVSALMSMLVFDRETDCRRAALGALRWYNEKGDGTMREDYYLMLCPHWRELMLPAGAMLFSTSVLVLLSLKSMQCPLSIT
ncbi:tubulin-specific chaperone D-like [Zootermopsis nevadensis]|uniref:Tubulin-specific chaperone D n=1 Tax=Zootermopsis nevadensis TaxID=136037 RepID=A0A067R9E4_ZOONE|nr:tubulin-specific chaperone D-like [Zootermopsis nevadensis]KDR20191.1 Tubulin-specific chaperone D [Zootermopsis nevadensis]